MSGSASGVGRARCGSGIMAFPIVAVATGHQGQTGLTLQAPQVAVKATAATHGVVYVLQENGSVVSLSPRISRMPFQSKVSFRFFFRNAAGGGRGGHAGAVCVPLRKARARQALVDSRLLVMGGTFQAAPPHCVPTVPGLCRSCKLLRVTITLCSCGLTRQSSRWAPTPMGSWESLPRLTCCIRRGLCCARRSPVPGPSTSRQASPAPLP